MRTDIYMVLDESGSMASSYMESIQAFDRFVAEQRQVPGGAALSLVTFNTDVTVRADRVPLLAVKSLKEYGYSPHELTALYDAIGMTLNGVKARLDKPDLVVLCVITDGLENASRNFTQAQVKALIEEGEREGWLKVVFLGSNLDVVAAAQSLSVPKHRASVYDARNVGTAYAAASSTVTQLRTAPAVGNGVQWPKT